MRRELELQTPQAILGHSQANVTQVDAERDLTKGMEVLRWAKRNEDRFFAQILPKVMAKSAKTDSRAENELAAKEEQALATRERLFSDDHVQWEQEAVADTA